MNEHYLSITYIALALLATIFLVAKRTRRREVQAEHHHHPHHTPEPATTAEAAHGDEDNDHGDNHEEGAHGGDHGHGHDEPKPKVWWRFVLIWALVLLFILPFVLFFTGLGGIFMKGNILADEAKKNPDSHEWVLSIREPYGNWQKGVARGIHRETNPLSHAVTLRWYSSELGGDIIATWDPSTNQSGWVCINGVGKKIYGDFIPQTVTDTIIVGKLEGEDPSTKTWKVKEFELNRVD